MEQAKEVVIQEIPLPHGLKLIKQVNYHEEKKIVREIHKQLAINLDIATRIKKTKGAIVKTQGDIEYQGIKLLEISSEIKTLIDLYFKLVKNKYKSKVVMSNGSSYTITDDVLREWNIATNAVINEILYYYNEQRSIINSRIDYDKIDSKDIHLEEYPDNGINLSNYIDLGILTE